MLKSEKILLATTVMATSIFGGACLLTLKDTKEKIEYVSPIVSKNPFSPVLLSLRDIKKEATPALFINIDPLEKQSARDVLKKVAGRIPTPPHKPKFKEAYQAIAAHMKPAKEPSTEQEKPPEALAYAPQENPLEKAINLVRSMSFTPAPTFKPQPGIAVYKITEHKVYLPNGEAVEAHSGLGHMRDNPQYTHVKMRGPTPPHMYDLSWRERPFHGVKAIRLTPIGGASAIHNRDGLLAHTYMLNPEGASNGCVSFRDYLPFQRAFERGEIQKLAVVP